jgi:hypothetical protein
VRWHLDTATGDEDVRVGTWRNVAARLGLSVLEPGIQKERANRLRVKVIIVNIYRDDGR